MTQLIIESLAHDLRGIAHADGAVWFVEGVLPGEQVQARELAKHQGRVDAVASDILNASVHRVEPRCEYVSRCGGCSVQHMEHTAQIHYKQQILLEQLKRIGKISEVELLPALVAEPWAYRRRTRLACRWFSERKHLAVGYRQRHSQDIVEIEHCAVLVPALEKLLPALRDSLSRWSQPKQLGHIELLAADNGVGMLLRVLSPPSEKDGEILQTLATVYGLTVYLQQEEKAPVRFFCGVERTLVTSHGDGQNTMQCVPGDFLQGNAVVNNELVNAVLSALQPQKTDGVLEAFCGLGNFTLPLAQQVKVITALEVSEAMVKRAQQQEQRATIKNVEFSVQDLSDKENCKTINTIANKVLLDPPRDGAQAFCQNVRLDNVERIVYVSCNPSTLARDAAILVERGFVMESIRLVDMFPQTSHIEALSVFHMSDSKKIHSGTTEQTINKKIKELKRLKR
jgi:23S rRNA (uracil1939-C5)-methyltransferase